MTKSLLPLLLVSASLTAHAGFLDSFSKDKKQETAPAKTEAAPAQPAASGEITAEAKKIAAELSDAFKAELGAASKKALEDAKALMADPAASAPLKEQLAKLTDSLTGAKDGTSAEALAKIVALKPTPEQMTLVKDLQSQVGTLVLGRNFDQKDPATGSAVKATLDAIKAKDTGAVIAQLQKVAAGTKLTDAQKQMVGNLLSSWNPKVAEAVEKAKKGAEVLKGFGL